MPCIGRVASVGGMQSLAEMVGTRLGMDILRSEPTVARRFVEQRDTNLSMTCGFLSRKVSRYFEELRENTWLLFFFERKDRHDGQ